MESTLELKGKVALSMWQPWASLLAAGIKTVETRGKGTKFRGEFYIHATATVPKLGYELYCNDQAFRDACHKYLELPDHARLTWERFRTAWPVGLIVGKARLVAVMDRETFKSACNARTELATGIWPDAFTYPRELALGDLSTPQRHAWICQGHRHFSPFQMVSAKGRQQWFWPIDPDKVRTLV